MPGCCSSDHCGAAANTADKAASPRYRRVLWIALVINALMFGVELLGGVRSGSMSLLADAIDFAGDAANYGVALAVLSMGLIWRARAALIKGLCMGLYGCFILGKTVWAVGAGLPPEPLTMGLIALLALCANAGVAFMLYAWRDGDANMRSVWLCSRNDAIGNFAVALAALGVFGTGTAWPDLAVAAIMGGLALQAAVHVIGRARRELAGTVPPLDAHGHMH